MNQLLRNSLAVEGLDNAMKLARTLIELDYQVFVQRDDCDIYIVAYESNNSEFGGPEFASVDADEYELIYQHREEQRDNEARARCALLNEDKDEDNLPF